MAGITDIFKTQGKELKDLAKKQGSEISTMAKGRAGSVTAEVVEKGKKYIEGVLNKLPKTLSPEAVSKPKVTAEGEIKMSPAKKSKSKKDLLSSKGGFVMYGIVIGLGFLVFKILKRKK